VPGGDAVIAIGAALVAAACLAAGAVRMQLGLAIDLTPAETAAIVGAAADGQGVVAIDLTNDHILPTTWTATVYLAPEDAGRVIRRGRTVAVSCTVPSIARCPDWRRTGAGAYAQVDRGHPPFDVDGEFSDRELVTIVRLVRTSRDLRLGDRPGREPVRWIRHDGADVLVTTTKDNGSGQTITLRRSGSTWRIVEVGMWIV
jgi:hypothetical protein